MALLSFAMLGRVMRLFPRGFRVANDEPRPRPESILWRNVFSGSSAANHIRASGRESSSDRGCLLLEPALGRVAGNRSAVRLPIPGRRDIQISGTPDFKHTSPLLCAIWLNHCQP